MMNDKTRLRTFGVLFGSGCLFLFGLMVFLFAAGIVLAIFLLTHGYLAAKLLAMVIVLVFAAAGVGLMVLAWKIPGRERDRRQRRACHPKEPWLWREDWEQGFSQAEGRSHARFLMTSGPGVLGGKLQGCVKSGVAAAGIEVNLTLSCISWRRGYHSSFSEILWQEQTKATSSPGADGGQVSVDFDIPFDLRSTENCTPENPEEVFWRLTARSGDGGFHASFTVPIFRTADSDPSRTRERLEAQAGSRLGGYSPAPNRIETVETPEGIRYRFPSGRNRSTAAMVSVFGLIFLGIAIVLGVNLKEWLALGSLFGVLFTAAFGIVMSLMALWLWFAVTTITAATGQLRIQSSCLGISRTCIVHAEDIRGFEIKPGIQRGAEVWYDLWLQVASGDNTNAGTGMDKIEAEWLVAELRKDLGTR
jgi:hypothetical protein